MIKTYTYKLKSNPKVEQKFNQWLGICRFVYNMSKSIKEDAYRKGVSLSAFDLSKQLPGAKQEAPWLSEVHSQTLQGMVERMDRSFQNFFRGAGYPGWASKKRFKSVPFKSISTTHNAFKLPKFGVVRVFRFKAPQGILKTATLIREADGLYLKVVVDEYNPRTYCSDNQAAVGLDMGVTKFLTTSDQKAVDNPRHLFQYLKQLRIENRSLSRKKKGSKNWYKQLKKLQKLYLKIKRTRLDFLQKQSTIIAQKYSTVYIEKLNIRGMARNTQLSQHILDCGWGTFFSLLEYKVDLIRVNPAYTSQECSNCGHVCPDNRRTQSHFECVECQHIENADQNAAKNIKKRGQSLLGVNVNQ